MLYWKKWINKKKKEGDKKTPKGTFEIENLYLEKIVKKNLQPIKMYRNQKDMGWCDDYSFPKKYNKLFKLEKKINHEKLKRKDYKYDFLIPIKYNFKKPITGHGSCIFIHLTKIINQQLVVLL